MIRVGPRPLKNRGPAHALVTFGAPTANISKYEDENILRVF